MVWVFQTVRDCQTMNRPYTSVAYLFRQGTAKTLSRVNYGLKTSSVLVFVNVLSSGIGSLTTLKIANVLGKTHFGEMGFAYVIGGFIATLVIFGQDRTLVRELVHRPEERATMVFAAFFLNLILFAFSVGALALARMIGYEKYLGLPVMILATTVAMQSLDIRSIYDVSGRISRHSVHYLVQRSVYFAFIWSSVTWLPIQLTLMTIASSQLFAILFGLALQYRWAWKNILAKETFPSMGSLIRMSLHLLNQNLWVFIASVAAIALPSLNQVVLRRTVGLDALGGYFACWQIAGLAMLIATQVSRIGVPAIARYTVPGRIDKAGCKKVLVLYGTAMGAFGLVIAFPLVMAPEIVLSLLFSQEYRTEVLIMQIMGVYIFVYFIGIVASQFVLSLKKERMYLFSIVVAGVLNVGLCFYFIPTYKGGGAAFSLLASHGIAIALYCLSLLLFFVHRDN
jgi:O-antigen/teichoic acid export membrane protein